jgi:nucleoid DNA-binding protein
MDIILYLTECLQTRKTIGIVGLGTFFKKKTPGKYDAVQHAFVPPSYQLSFTTTVNEDSDLANYISNKRNITTESANYYIGEFAEQIQNQLADTQEADLGEIGKLKLVNDEITLIADQSNSFGFEFFGLPTLAEPNPIVEKEDTPSVNEDALEAIEEENKLEEENPGFETDTSEHNLNDDQPIYDEIVEVTEEPFIKHQLTNEPPVVETIEDEVIETHHAITWDEEVQEEEVPKKKTPLFIKFLVVLLIIVAAGAIAYFINPKFFDTYIQQNFESKPAKNIPIAPKDTLNNKIDSPQVDSLAKNNALVTLVKDSTAIDTTKTYYEVIGTSESSLVAADNYIARLAKKGIIAKHIKLSKRRFDVSIGTFQTQKEALMYADSLKIVLKSPGIYPLPFNPKKTKK